MTDVPDTNNGMETEFLLKQFQNLSEHHGGEGCGRTIHRMLQKMGYLKEIKSREKKKKTPKDTALGIYFLQLRLTSLSF